MKPYEIENWAIRVVERVNARQPNEDSRVELKAEWPEPAKAARRIAGHANSAGGDHILWLIGVDQTSAVVGADHKEFANWLAQVRTQFDELFAPPVVDLNVPWNGKTIVALVFQTDRKPFVVKNAAFGKPNGGPVALEVPWRDGTAIRSASRRDLLQLLVPLQLVPDCEVHNAQLVAKLATTKQGKRGLTW